jgi:hypothetical protein
MKISWRSAAAAGTGVLWLTAAVWVGQLAAESQAPKPAAGKKAGEAFKNVTTSTLKELSVDDFVASMGLISANLGLDCADCHPRAGTDQADFVIDTPRKQTTRRMVEMVAALNRTNFGGVQRVTCWTCHHGRITPATTIALDAWYDTPNTEVDDLVRTESGQPTADQILDKYIQAVGGAERLAGLKSFVATGTAVAYGELGGNADFTILASAPNQRTTVITYKDHPDRGTSMWSFDGRIGWTKTPRGLLGEYELVGGELDGVRLEAQLSFPGQIKQVLDNWRGGTPRSLGDRDFLAVQGSGAKGFWRRCTSIRRPGCSRASCGTGRRQSEGCRRRSTTPTIATSAGSNSRSSTSSRGWTGATPRS